MKLEADAVSYLRILKKKKVSFWYNVQSRYVLFANGWPKKEFCFKTASDLTSHLLDCATALGIAETTFVLYWLSCFSLFSGKWFFQCGQIYLFKMVPK